VKSLAPSLILVERALLWLKLANLLTEVKLTNYWSSTHCRKIQELNPLLV